MAVTPPVLRVCTHTATKQLYSFDPHMLDTPKAHVETFKGSLQYQGPVLWTVLLLIRIPWECCCCLAFPLHLPQEIESGRTGYQPFVPSAVSRMSDDDVMIPLGIHNGQPLAGLARAGCHADRSPDAVPPPVCVMSRPGNLQTLELELVPGCQLPSFVVVTG
ncbi:hypothetical protein Bbelb_077660 [Branchiostoma belcheri]|nr:hypothetical protein Bbelb_077660 [Branchiostoma belcheri]